MQMMNPRCALRTDGYGDLIVHGTKYTSVGLTTHGLEGDTHIAVFRGGERQAAIGTSECQGTHRQSLSCGG